MFQRCINCGIYTMAFRFLLHPPTEYLQLALAVLNVQYLQLIQSLQTISWSCGTMWPSKFSGYSRLLHPITTGSQYSPLGSFVPTVPVSPTLSIAPIGPSDHCIPAGLHPPTDPVSSASQGSCRAIQSDCNLTMSYQY